MISGNGGNGINIQVGSNGNIIRGNTIGLNAAGAAAVANTLNGISLNGVSGTTIGGTLGGAGNVIAGNSANGIIAGAGTASTVIQGNRIGTDAAGTASLPNGGHGVSLNGNGTTVGGTAAGAANIIANNGMVGVRVNAGTGHAIVSNSIFANANLGIDLSVAGVTPNDLADADTGPNNLQNFPVLTAVPGGVTGTLNSIPVSTFTVQFFGNSSCDPSGNGEGQTFLGSTSVTTDSNGNGAIPLFATAAGTIVTATAISSQSDTSEFSACVTVLTGPASFTVSNTNDSGAGSLRQAILNANASVGTFDTITFNIGGPGPFRIAPASPLPTITDSVSIDGTTQPGFANVPLIELDGVGAGGTSNGLWLTANGNVVRGLVINRFGTNGALNAAGGAGIVVESNGNSIQGNFIGTDITGTQARPNRMDGLSIDHASNLIGGATPSARNVISGNGRHGILVTGANGAGNTVLGNYVGVDATGVLDLGNGVDGVNISSQNNTIGGSGTGAGNIIAGNDRIGVLIAGPSATGNRVSATGSALPPAVRLSPTRWMAST